MFFCPVGAKLRSELEFRADRGFPLTGHVLQLLTARLNWFEYVTSNNICIKRLVISAWVLELLLVKGWNRSGANTVHHFDQFNNSNHCALFLPKTTTIKIQKICSHVKIRQKCLDTGTFVYMALKKEGRHSQINWQKLNFFQLKYFARQICFACAFICSICTCWTAAQFQHREFAGAKLSYCQDWWKW